MRRYTLRRDRNAVALFDRATGNKIRFAIGSYPKASRPELADVTITDWCDVGCSFCYRGSDLQGRHATWDNLERVVDALAKARVFEVALGGGETTSHPQFVELLRQFRSRGVIPNFTTKKPAAVRKLWPEIKDLIGGFAYSAETPGQIRMAHKLFDGHIPARVVSLHYVMGLGDRQAFQDYLRTAHACGYRVTLLGYKTTGRGAEVIPHPYDWWIDAVSELITEGQCPTLSIDTPLAGQYQEQLPLARYMYHTQEGKYSVYIDAVTMKLGASSFEDLTSLDDFHEDTWLETYRSY